MAFHRTLNRNESDPPCNLVSPANFLFLDSSADFLQGLQDCALQLRGQGKYPKWDSSHHTLTTHSLLPLTLGVQDFLANRVTLQEFPPIPPPFLPFKKLVEGKGVGVEVVGVALVVVEYFFLVHLTEPTTILAIHILEQTIATTTTATTSKYW